MVDTTQRSGNSDEYDRIIPPMLDQKTSTPDRRFDLGFPLVVFA